jgi:hypothetical protein
MSAKAILARGKNDLTEIEFAECGLRIAESAIEAFTMAFSFGLIGGGWRGEFYPRIARDLPEQLPLAGVVVRNPEKRARFARAWSVPAFATVEELLAEGRLDLSPAERIWLASRRHDPPFGSSGRFKNSARTGEGTGGVTLTQRRESRPEVRTGGRRSDRRVGETVWLGQGCRLANFPDGVW